MDLKLAYSNYFAIPLEINDESNLFPQPNWLVIDNIFGKLNAELPMLGNVICAQSIYKLSFREILPPNIELGRFEEIREIVYENQNQPIPMNVVPYFTSYETLKEHLNEVNLLLSLFQFRGILTNFKLKVDENLLDEIIQQNNENLLNIQN